MEAIYRQTVTLPGTGVSDLLHLLQETASQHQTSLGMGRREMYHRGLLWMITRQKLVFYRTPADGEEVTVSTWLSEGKHGMYLRQYEVSAAADDVICRAAAIWTLVDAEKRVLSMTPLAVPFCQSDAQMERFPLLRSLDTVQEYTFTVPAEYLDENGHMNNARYFDAVAPILPKGGILHTAQVDYHAEAREGEVLTIGYTGTDHSLSVQAWGDRGLCFRMKLEYE